MAGYDDMAGHGANGADGPPEDLRAILDNLAYEISGASTRHSESLHDMQGRVAAMSDRANAAKSGLPHEYGSAIDRLEAAMASFAEHLADAEPIRHRAAPAGNDTDDALPETVRSEIRRAIEGAQRTPDGSPPVLHSAVAAAPSRPTLGEAAFGSDMHPAPAAMPRRTERAASPAAAIEPTWLEARFADIADRVEQSLAAHSPNNALLSFGARFDQLEQRFDRALDEIANRPGAGHEALKTVERQITELFAQLDRATGQLGRLDAIESRLTDLRESLSDEQMAHLVSALAPTDEKLAAIATSAAERVAASLRSEMPATPAASSTAGDPRLAELTTMLDAFIGEQRQGGVLTTEALDTLHEAMQHLIDRVEAIEAAQIAGYGALMLPDAPPAAAAPYVPEGFAMRTPPAAPVAMAEAEAPLAPIDEMPERLGPEAPPELSIPASVSRLPKADAAPSVKPSVGGDLDRQTMIAMARRAAEKASSTAPPAPRGRSFWPLSRANLLMATGGAVLLLAGTWLLAGPNLSGIVPSFHIGAFRGEASTPLASPPAQDTREKQQGSLSDQAASAAATAGRTDGDEPQPEARAQPASLTTRVEPHPTRAASAMPSTADLLAVVDQASRAPAVPVVPSRPDAPVMTRAVEMPPAMIGPLSLRHAAAKGDPRAQFEVAARFAEGKGVPQDFDQAATWYQRAATQGFATAQYRLATLYERGLGVAADPARARVWYNRAAEQGNLRAMHNLAVLNAGRPGTKPDYPAAIQWFAEAANRGLADSQYNLGILYESGLGVPANNLEAYKWYALAARSGDKDAARRRNAVRTKLDSTSLRSADALVIQWRAKAIDPETNDARIAGQAWQPVRQ